MKDARYLIRLANQGGYRPQDQASLLKEVRELVSSRQGKVINLRVSPVAVEFDLFCSPDLALEPFFEAWGNLGESLTAKRLDEPKGAAPAQDIVTEARQFFNEQRFWEVHEVLEGLWLQRQGPEKELLQGLILAAAALVHVQKGEEAVARTMMRDALRRLDNQPSGYLGWDIKKFRDHFTRVLESKTLDIPTV
jgi:hypothetical protein